MDKRYQVFVSSTYTDLKEERQLVTQTLMKMDCIPAGMELFPASDEEQFEFIKRVIDDCDYYLLIIGGRYGSVTEEGISYTEKEYDYALEKGLKVVALLHGNPGSIPIDKSEASDKARRRLAAFREKVKQNRLVEFWTDKNALAGQVAIAMMNAMKIFPAVGWIRANKAATEDLLNDMNALRKKNEELQKRLQQLTQNPVVPEYLADLDDKHTVQGKFSSFYNDSYHYRNWTRSFTWRELFRLIAPYLMESAIDSDVKNLIADNIALQDSWSASIDDQDFQTIKIQFQALKLVKVAPGKSVKGDYYTYWSLTPSGKALAFDLRSVKKNNDKEA